MQPGHLYFLCMAVIVMPLLPFSRTAVVVGLAWLPGQVAHFVGWDTTTVDMAVALMACGAALGAAANDRDRAIGILYMATFCVQFSAAVGNTTAYDAWWLDWGLAMTRVLLLPATVNWEAARDVYDAFRRRREWDAMIWKRALCWR